MHWCLSLAEKRASRQHRTSGWICKKLKKMVHPEYRNN